MTWTALKEAAQDGIPREKIVGPTATCTEQNLIPAGEAAIGFICVARYGTWDPLSAPPPGPHACVYARGKGAGPERCRHARCGSRAAARPAHAGGARHSAAPLWQPARDRVRKCRRCEHLLCCAGVGQTPSLSQRRGAGPQVARPVERLSWRSSKAVSRCWAVLRARRASGRARPRARSAASATLGARDRGQSPGAPQAGQRDRITAMLVDPIARLCGGSGRGPPPSRHGLVGSESGRANPHRGPLHKPSTRGWLLDGPDSA